MLGPQGASSPELGILCRDLICEAERARLDLQGPVRR
jgi:hypothetical protein